MGQQTQNIFCYRLHSAIMFSCIALLTACSAAKKITNPSSITSVNRTSLTGSNTDKGDIQYIIFKLTNVGISDIDSTTAQIAQIIGPNDVNRGRFWGIGIWGIDPLTQSPDEMAKIVNAGFDLALKYHVAIHFDLLVGVESYFTYYGNGNQTLIQNDTDLCEWTSLPGPGQSPQCPQKSFDWGKWSDSPAMPAYGSPKYRDFLTQQIQNGVIPTLKARYQQLINQNQEYLFAGVALGGETAFDYVTDPACPPSGQGVWGYNTLRYISNLHPEMLNGHSAGYYAANPLELVKFLNITAVSDFLRFLSQMFLNASGLPRYKLFTHVIPSDVAKDNNTFNVYSTVKSGTSPYALVGFTFSPGGQDVSLEKTNYIRSQVQQNLATYGTLQDPTFFTWAVEETYGSFYADGAAFNSYLRSTLGNGAKLIAILGWTDPQSSLFYFPKDPNHFVLAGVRSWLAAGGTQPEGLFTYNNATYYSNGRDSSNGGAYCWVDSPATQHACGWDGRDNPSRGNLPTFMRKDDACGCGGSLPPPSIIPAGKFYYAAATFISDGKGNYCNAADIEALTQLGLSTANGDAPIYSSISSSMINQGVCAWSVPAGAFVIGSATYISDGKGNVCSASSDAMLIKHGVDPSAKRPVYNIIPPNMNQQGGCT